MSRMLVKAATFALAMGGGSLTLAQPVRPPVGPVAPALPPGVTLPPGATAPEPEPEPEPAEPPDSREPTGPHGKLAPLTFYQGPVMVEAVFGSVDLVRGEAPKASLQVALLNRSARPEVLALGFRGGQPTPVKLDPGGRATVPLTALASHVGKGDGAQLVRVDLVLEGNGVPMGTPPERADLQVRLPAGVRSLLRANQPMKPADQGPNGGIYRLSTARSFLAELVLAYNGGPVTLDIDKSVDGGAIRAEGPVSVKLVVTNRSGEGAKGVRLTDNFDPRDFDGVGDGFKVVTGKDNDERLVWEGEVAPLAPGQSQTIVLQLKAKHPVGAASLSAAMAVMDGSLVGVSNKVVLAPLDGQK
jgi:hypothetical protein